MYARTSARTIRPPRSLPRIRVRSIPKSRASLRREGEAAGAEGLLGQAQQDDRVLAAREEEHGALELRRDLAQDVDRLGLERVEVGEADEAVGGAHGVAQAWSPHSDLAVAAQRPSRPSPGCVQCVQPIDA